MSADHTSASNKQPGEHGGYCERPDDDSSHGVLSLM